jgi:hypothetical protein
MTDLVCAQAIYNHFNKGQQASVSQVFAGAQKITKCALTYPGPDNDKIAIYMVAFDMEKETLIAIGNREEEDKGPMEAVRTVAGPILLAAEENLARALVLAKKHNYADLKDQIDEDFLGAQDYAKFLQNGTTAEE